MMKRSTCLQIAIILLASLLTSIAAAQQDIESVLERLKTAPAGSVAKVQEEIAKIGKPAAEPLYALIRDENDKAKDALSSAIAEAFGGNVAAGERLQSEARRHDANISRAFETLAKIGPPALEVLLTALNDGESRYRGMVLDSFVTIGDKSVVASLKVFAEKEPSARSEVMTALEKLESGK
jgi:HEAT repeat protein